MILFTIWLTLTRTNLCQISLLSLHAIDTWAILSKSAYCAGTSVFLYKQCIRSESWKSPLELWKASDSIAVSSANWHGETSHYIWNMCCQWIQSLNSSRLKDKLHEAKSRPIKCDFELTTSSLLRLLVKIKWTNYFAFPQPHRRLHCWGFPLRTTPLQPSILWHRTKSSCSRKLLNDLTQ